MIDGVTVDVNAGPLRTSSNLRLIVVPADSPDAIADVAEFTENSTPIQAVRARLTLPGGPAGRDEVRLYHVPRFGQKFEVAARAPITVQPGTPGALLIRDLGREAMRVGPVKFEATYRNNPVLIQAQFLRVRPRTEWNTKWQGGLIVGETPQNIALISIGTLGLAAELSATPVEALCIVSAEDKATLNRISSFNPGDAILVRGEPSSWLSAGNTDPLLIKNCRIAN